MAIIAKIKTFIKGLPGASQPQRAKVKQFLNPMGNVPYTKNIVPFSAGAAGVATLGSKIRSAATGVKNLASRATINPLAGAKNIVGGLKTFGSKIGGTALGFATGATAFGISRLATSGDPINLKTIGRSTLVGIGVGLNPVSGFAGATVGLGENYVGKAGGYIDTISYPKDLPTYNVPSLPQMPDYGFSPQTSITLPTMQMPQMDTPSYSAGSFNPSISVGGGGGFDPLMLMLLLGGAGAIGYGVAKKRKKKKYKKRRKR